ncbi:Uncharacterised protein [Metamycoplasma arthritidis]|uniref:HipA-like kinase domain-containing protein n=1 Tax=Metamycoplasma arthritidis (strain 158L3-1) TaxID=243272 RepID=B3PMT5_META1|nr:HipA family kinase [Metamycoplasma arthritidis]ACF07337.1 conserved hypothetical protein [Metamycoplasma arthritidis 158L3-1]VEU78860.1 Uncharacterised protein [Metamycoplasma arthritidis]
MHCKYFFRNKDYDCFSFIFNRKSNSIEDIKPLEGFDYLLPFLKDASLEDLREYLIFERPLPISRENFQEIFGSNFDIFSLYEFSYGLNLDDTFWVVPETKQHLKWEEVNLYTNFSNNLTSIMLSNQQARIVEKISPDFFTNGILKKSWVKEENNIYLYKSNSQNLKQTDNFEIYSEYFASQVAKALELNYVAYDVIKYNDKLINKCKIFTSEFISYLPFSLIFKKTINLDFSLLENSIETIFGKNELEDLMVFDALILNVDRHLGNFGLLVDNFSHQKITNAPIFDNGRSLVFDFALFDNKLAKKYLDNYSKRSSKVGISFDEQLEKYLQPRHKEWFSKLDSFLLKNHPIFPCKRPYFRFVKKLIENRIKLLKMTYQKKFNA